MAFLEVLETMGEDDRRRVLEYRQRFLRGLGYVEAPAGGVAENPAVYSYSAELQGRERRRPEPESRYGSGYIGVRRNRYGGKFAAVIRVDGRQRHLGSFDTEIEAAEVYDEAAMQVHGDGARVNFPSLAQGR